VKVGQQPNEVNGYNSSSSAAVSRQNSGSFGDPKNELEGGGSSGSGISGGGGGPPSLLSSRLETLEGIGDLDYLTHIVFRMYEVTPAPSTLSPQP
jgi:hypothetical protein